MIIALHIQEPKFRPTVLKRLFKSLRILLKECKIDTAENVSSFKLSKSFFLKNQIKHLKVKKNRFYVKLKHIFTSKEKICTHIEK